LEQVKRILCTVRPMSLQLRCKAFHLVAVEVPVVSVF
jgi:hypothetical protein